MHTFMNLISVCSNMCVPPMARTERRAWATPCLHNGEGIWANLPTQQRGFARGV